MNVIMNKNKNGFADVVLNLAGPSKTYEMCMTWLKPGGKLLVVGYDLINPVKVSSHSIMRKEMEIFGCRAMTRKDLMEVIKLIESGKIIPIVDKTIPLESVNEAYDMLRNGDVIGRLVLIP